MEQIKQEKRTVWSKFKSFVIQCRRVFRITKKPNKEEFKTIVKVSALGILIIGSMGFLIDLIWTLVKG
ncbi:MAG: protein translocase SEC61 complex subunit gamma [Nanoarchaeota archaeon]|nr:protein translocase SEC61 complex subunit gamma [Nanoarchaeota archaeon]MBU1445562.1 protein translocase SEC61 complex subunit gamma [Nanoarchaeota archaeon]MBU2406386.1 protein translocase SEC61 complex subunit gamma [Nanoarchaeota archaeon]MBU2420757.1 protein translocase SEC61 complex subunit gamma [Nanoarchaeota archaeon]MBU2475451.1 protein translocase SEC61 complex subunit gamma [Nanoarchaeota archaeon]